MVEWAGRVSRIRVIGTGVMGRGIVQLAATGGVTVELADSMDDAVGKAIEYVGGMLDRLAAKGRLTEEQARAAKDRLVPVGDPLAPAEGVDLVLEAVREDLEIKRTLFAGLERVCGQDTVFATNTSSLSVTEIAAGLSDPGRLIGLHFFNPVPLMRLVEVVPGARTAPWLPAEALELVRHWGHEPVLAKDAPGFLVNHAGRGLNTEALQILSEGLAEPADVDRVARDVLGLKLGPFELLDLTGLDVSHAVLESIWSGFHSEPRLRPSWLTRPRVAAGLYGRKNGEGFYRYSEGKQEVAPEPSAPPLTGTPVYTADERLGRMLSAAGVQVVPDAYPDAALLVPLRGESTVEAARQAELPPERVSGVDALGYDKRFTLSVHPGLDPAFGRAAWAALAATGVPVTVVRDGPAPIAQRLLASIVNTAGYLAAQNLATPADIDTAVRLGLGYPRGPLEWGETLGAEKVLRILTGLLHATGDPRYRPSSWLTERVTLGLPLTTSGTRPADLR
ncbi:3-hydroxyacyl-CoA dehydrogenase [Amycolatopsis jiangsuensis]|uniref:3-hydroxybutyryl-CoA dehydrogenase n=1 Tax=Amycolatopsis jiangsuensis TaxID=1181879 RepID=A0A840J1W6_9PSEU|nr:3-hydroxyacyl-CoA dehydrogenase [Amycolatopsis jiangsuensis]MBB4687635.1 3-hydroxybutyryl-CoA dehydrogenase [Amycolatopsis jiangsuensis]